MFPGEFICLCVCYVFVFVCVKTRLSETPSKLHDGVITEKELAEKCTGRWGGRDIESPNATVCTVAFIWSY